VSLLALAAPLQAANREHEQILADIRMLQEQTQRLQRALASLGDVLQTLTTKIDEQNAATRKGFADQKLLVDTVAGDLRVLREKLDETNVRLSSLSQDVEGVREAIPRMMAPPPAPYPGPGAEGAPSDPTGDNGDDEAAADAGFTPPPVAPAPNATGMSPKRLYDQAFADYTAGQWMLAIQGFEAYMRTYPQSDLADDAQYYIGEAYSGDSRFDEAVAAYERVIRDYPQSDILPEAWYKVGVTYERLGDPEKAREAYEYTVANFESTDAGRLSRQRMESLNRR
jgi:tol-pal system protein YbgF